MPKKPSKSIDRSKAEEAVELLASVISSGVDEYVLNDMPCMMMPEVSKTLGLLYPDGAIDGQAVLVKGTLAHRVASDAIKLASYLGLVDLADTSILLSPISMPTIGGPGSLYAGPVAAVPDELMSTVSLATARDNLKTSMEWVRDAQRYLYLCRVSGFAGVTPLPKFPGGKDVTAKEYGDGAFEIRSYHYNLGMDVRDAVTVLFDKMGSDFSKRVMDCVSTYVKSSKKD